MRGLPADPFARLLTERAAAHEFLEHLFHEERVAARHGMHAFHEWCAGGIADRKVSCHHVLHRAAFERWQRQLQHRLLRAQ